MIKATHQTTLLLNELYAPIRKDLDEAERIFDDELVGEYLFINELCDTIRSYRGKMLRPALLLLAGKATGRLTLAHSVLAAVIEMAHMATLVHDDVLDEADERRGQESVNSVQGNVAAVLLGDYLISHAYHLCSETGDPYAARRITGTTNAVCEGELLQNRHRGNVDLTEPEYFEIIRRKTGALTSVACELGAFYSGADETVVQAMALFGQEAGVAFQIVDDILDIMGDRSKVRKTLGRDLGMGKATLPTIHCLRHATPETGAALRRMIRGDEPHDASVLRSWLQATGSIEYAVSSAERAVATAMAQLDQLPPSDARSSLASMAEFIIRRQF